MLFLLLSAGLWDVPHDPFPIRSTADTPSKISQDGMGMGWGGQSN